MTDLSRSEGRIFSDQYRTVQLSESKTVKDDVRMVKDKIDVRNLNLWFTDRHILQDLSLSIKSNSVTAIMGPSGCGKTTFIRAINRMNEIIEGCRTTGEVFLDGVNIYDEKINVFELRKKVGMVHQKPNPFPKSIFDNAAYGLRIHNMVNGKKLEKDVEQALREAALWDEVNDRLKESALRLSGGQQQRLCIARALAVKPEVILFDEPCSALDPTATAKIEGLIQRLKENYTVVIVTHNLQQAARVSDFVAFLYLGRLIEYGRTKDMFINPKNELTERYITGKFG
ncbi:MAG: phosphate ABC transporter ATP-binding protein PstB [Candidatus Methylarchaceae archaeon HK02M1]|nr:phosphate ABC transporter ATP-binding protein PstB [Candidatus Methylarchaceae archaeon HK01M]MCP8311524.1 phosphate ABC transporter ATP-binding protein PstB [Candidatus Methylarchaceae archaeon HK02M1]